ncbi:MAG: hypothetical protein WEA28_17360 [Xanthobacteraceae bacterium]|jgi:hypothetical protein
MVTIAADRRKFFYQSSVKAGRGMLRGIIAGCNKSLKFAIFKTAPGPRFNDLLRRTKVSIDLSHA